MYNTNPQVNPGSTDMLGLVADNSVGLNPQHATGGLTIDAALFAKSGSFTYMNYDGSLSGYPGGTMGSLNVLGSITQNLRGAVGTVNADGSLNTGYLKNYKFDNRFYSKNPPFYPAAANRFQLISWRE